MMKELISAVMIHKLEDIAKNKIKTILFYKKKINIPMKEILTKAYFFLNKAYTIEHKIKNVLFKLLSNILIYFGINFF